MRRRLETRAGSALGVLALVASLPGCWMPSVPDVLPSEFSLGVVPLNGFGYTVTFRRGGMAADIRHRDLAADVECVGAVTPGDYERVANLILAEDFFDLDALYGRHPDYPPTVTTSATSNGRARTVRNYPQAAPPELVRIQRAIRELRESTTWQARSGDPLDQRLCAADFFFGSPD